MENFNKRLLYILESNDLSASQFATKIGVQRSSVSHVLSGRNKPSLDFLIKKYIKKIINITIVYKIYNKIVNLLFLSILNCIN